jgi:hypothetical protein
VVARSWPQPVADGAGCEMDVAMYRFTDDHSSHTCLLFRLSWSPSFCRIRELRQDQTSSARGAEVLVGTRLTHTKGDPALFRSPAHHTLADLSRVLTSTAGEHQGVDASMAAATTAMHAWSRFADPGHADPDHRPGPRRPARPAVQGRPRVPVEDDDLVHGLAISASRSPGCSVAGAQCQRRFRRAGHAEMLR